MGIDLRRLRRFLSTGKAFRGFLSSTISACMGSPLDFTPEQPHKDIDSFRRFCLSVYRPAISRSLITESYAAFSSAILALLDVLSPMSGW